MGREIKRVPIDFDWPLRKTWDGFLLPRELRLPVCTDCNGTGERASGGWVRGALRMLLMAADDVNEQARGRDRLHPYLAESEFKPTDIIYGERAVLTRFVTRRPDETILKVAEALTGEEPDSIFGYGSISQWRAVARLLELLGLPEDLFICPTCKGTGEVGTPEQKAAYEAWEPTPVPEGEAYQLWETVSEGSPVSPPFADKRGLAEWMARHDCTVKGPFSSVEAALRFIEAGWGPSFVATAETGLMDGSEFMAQEAAK